MTMSSKHWLPGVLVLASFSAFAVAAQQNSMPVTGTSKPANTAKRTVPQSDEGQRIFQQHCSRCHTAPDGFSPRISGTVVRHMRVRASLSQHEEEELLRFFNP
jgi:mono/diheme cytochrome c family protein